MVRSATSDFDSGRILTSETHAQGLHGVSAMMVEGKTGPEEDPELWKSERKMVEPRLCGSAAPADAEVA